MARVTARQGREVRTELVARKFSWVADEPVLSGGTDTGPEPYELLLASLAACTTITLRLYAEHKGIALDGIDVETEFDRVDAGDCAECGDEDRGLIERVRTQVTLHGDFDEAQKKRLEQIAGRCPVHRSLAKGLRIFDQVAFAEPG